MTPDDSEPGHFTCPRCGRTSHHPTDAREGYCGACHDWTAPRRGR
jgi:ribosomal protein L37E